MSYAKGTTVTVQSSRTELERIVSGAGAKGFGFATDGDRSMVEFVMLADAGQPVRVRFEIRAPNTLDFKFTPTGKTRTTAQMADQRMAEERRLWRALVLLTKAKIEAVRSGISTIEREFMPDLVLGDGKTVEQHFGENGIAGAIEAGGELPMLPAAT